MTKRKSLLFYILLIGFVYASFEGMFYLGLRLLQAKGVAYHPLPSVLSQEQKHLIKSRIEDNVPLSGSAILLLPNISNII